MSRYIVTNSAKQDLKDIRNYLIQEAGQRVARSTMTRITDSFKRIGRTPGIGHTRQDLTDDAVRFWSVYSYMIVYRANKPQVEILRVLHGNRDLSTLLRQGEE